MRINCESTFNTPVLALCWFCVDSSSRRTSWTISHVAWPSTQDPGRSPLPNSWPTCMPNHILQFAWLISLPFTFNITSSRNLSQNASPLTSESLQFGETVLGGQEICLIPYSGTETSGFCDFYGEAWWWEAANSWLSGPGYQSRRLVPETTSKHPAYELSWRPWCEGSLQG